MAVGGIKDSIAVATNSPSMIFVTIVSCVRWCVCVCLISHILAPVYQPGFVVVVVFTLKTVLTSIQYPSLSYSSRQRNEFPWSQANPKIRYRKITIK